MLSCDYLMEFVTVVREGSLSKAALSLNVSQASLSRHMRALESALGVQLLNRASDGVNLTDEGYYVFTRAGDIADIVEDIEHHSSRGRKVGGFPIFYVGVFERYLRALDERCSGLRENGAPVKILSVSDAEVSAIDPMQAIESGKVRIYLTLATDSRLSHLDQNYRVKPTFTQGIVAVLEPHDELAKKERLEPEDLQGRTLIHDPSNRNASHFFWENTKALLRERGIAYRARTYVRREDSDWFFDFGDGLILLPELFSHVDIIRSGGKAVVPVEGLRLEMVAVYRADDELAGKIASRMAPIEPDGH